MTWRTLQHIQTPPLALALPPAVLRSGLEKHQQLGYQLQEEGHKQALDKTQVLPLLWVRIWVSAVFILFFSLACESAPCKSLGGTAAVKNEEFFFLSVRTAMGLNSCQKNSRRQGGNDEMRFSHDAQDQKPQICICSGEWGTVLPPACARAHPARSISAHLARAISELIASLQAREWDG